MKIATKIVLVQLGYSSVSVSVVRRVCECTHVSVCVKACACGCV